MKKTGWLQAVVLVGVLSMAGVASAQGFMASTQSKKFHTEQCQAAKKIKPETLKVFKTKAEAESAGFAACKRCKP